MSATQRVHKSDHIVFRVSYRPLHPSKEVTHTKEYLLCQLKTTRLLFSGSLRRSLIKGTWLPLTSSSPPMLSIILCLRAFRRGRSNFSVCTDRKSTRLNSS